MATWRDRVRAHPSRHLLADLLDAVRGATARSADDAAELERARLVAEYADRSLERTDPALIPISALDQVQSYLTSAIAIIGTYEAGTANLGDLTSPLDSILVFARALPASHDRRSPLAIASAEAIRDRNAEIIRGMEDRFATLVAELNETRSAIEVTRAEVSVETAKKVDELATTFSPLEARITDVANSVDSQRVSTQATIAAYNEQFLAGQAERSAAAAALLADLKSQGESSVGELRKTTDDETTVIVANAQAALDRTLEQERQARNLTSTIGAIGISSGWGRYAGSERRAANLWSLGVIGLVLAASIVPAIYILDVWNAGQSLDIQTLVGRFLVAVPGYLLGAYAVTQSAHHRGNAQRAKRIELELAAFNPFIELIDDAGKQKLRTEIASRYFGQQDPPSGAAIDPSATLDKLVDLLKAAISRK